MIGLLAHPSSLPRQNRSGKAIPDGDADRGTAGAPGSPSGPVVCTRDDTVTDPRGHTATYLYDALRRVTATTDALGHTATALYDARGRVTGATDALGRRTDYAYDAQGRLVTTTEAAAKYIGVRVSSRAK